MGIYVRPDSPWWWMILERAGQRPLRRSTGIPRDGGSALQNRELERQAQEYYALEKAKLIRGELQIGKPDILFRAYAQWYEQHVTSHYRSATRAASMLTRLTAAFGSTAVSTIDAHQIREWMTSRVAAGKKPRTVNRELDILKALLNSAVPKYLSVSPATGIRRLRGVEEERRVLTVPEEAKLLAVASDEEAALVILAIDSLLRLSNVVFLQWPQVKFDRDVIVPLNAKVSHDQVPLSSRCKAALQRLTKRGAYVFPSLHERGHGPTAAKNRAIRLFHDLCQKAGVKHGKAAGGVTFHSLRHTGASRALQAGASLRTVMKLGGWTDNRSILRYLHASDSDVKAAAESIGTSVVAFTPRSRTRKAH